MRVLVVFEHDNGKIRATSQSALTFARSLQCESRHGVEVSVLLLGAELGEAAGAATRFAPVIVADDASLRDPVADRHARAIADVVQQRGFDWLVATSSTYAKDVVGRAAGLLGGAMASDVVGHEYRDGELQLRRPMYAGSIIATIVMSGTPRVATVRASAYAPAQPESSAHPIEQWPIDASRLPSGTEYLGRQSAATQRPDLATARVVVSGGRAFKSAEEFEKHVGALADRLGGAAGSTRALVDAGITPNELQVGQTGKMVAPELYFALGLSGAIQHMAGMKNSKVVVAINSDPNAPIFEFANYGLVADVREAVPKLIDELKS